MMPNRLKKKKNEYFLFLLVLLFLYFILFVIYYLCIFIIYIFLPFYLISKISISFCVCVGGSIPRKKCFCDIFRFIPDVACVQHLEDAPGWLLR